MQRLAAAYGKDTKGFQALAVSLLRPIEGSSLATINWADSIREYILHDQYTHIVLAMFDYMNQDELCQIFDGIVYIASTSISYAGYIREVILGLPHDWVVDRIEASAVPFLDDPGDPDPFIAYSLLVGLYERLDAGITVRLAERAMRHTNEEIRELGELVFSEQSEAYHALLHKNGAHD